MAWSLPCLTITALPVKGPCTAVTWPQVLPATQLPPLVSHAQPHLPGTLDGSPQLSRGQDSQPPLGCQPVFSSPLLHFHHCLATELLAWLILPLWVLGSSMAMGAVGGLHWEVSAWHTPKDWLDCYLDAGGFLGASGCRRSEEVGGKKGEETRC